MKAACWSGSSLRETDCGLRCSISSRCSKAIRPDRLWYAMPHSVSIQAPTSRVIRGSVSVIQAFSRSCCTSLSHKCDGPWMAGHPVLDEAVGIVEGELQRDRISIDSSEPMKGELRQR